MDEVFIPAMGMAMEEAILLEWLKQPGEEVAAGEVVALIETDKSTMEVESGSAGRLGPHLHVPGARVAVGAAITRILAPGEADEAADEAPTAAPTAPAAEGGPAETAAVSPAAVALETAGTSATDVGRTGQYRSPHSNTPRQRRLAREAAAATPPAASAPVEPLAASRAERAAAQLTRAVTESWTTAPHFAVSREIDVTDLLHYLDGVRRSEPQVSVTDLLLRAAAQAWRGIRSSSVDAAALSVATTERRVVNVAVPGAATVPLGELAQRRRAAVERARRGVSTAADQTPTEMTVSNLGTHGVDWFTGIIPLGQIGLFTIGRIRSGLDVSSDSFRIRKLMWVTANLDHRELDGADGGVLLELFQEACSVSLGDPVGAPNPERKAL